MGPSFAGDPTLVAKWDFTSGLAGNPGPTIGWIRATISGMGFSGGANTGFTVASGDGPVHDHDPSTGAALGVGVWEGVRQLGLGTQDLSDNGGLLRVTLSLNQVVASDGTTTMDNILETTDTNTHVALFDNVAADSSTTYTVTWFIKKLNRQYVELDWNEDGGAGRTVGAVYDLDDDGTIVNTQNNTGQVIQNVGGGIFRLGFSGETAADTTNFIPRIWCNDDGGIQASYAGNTSNGVTAWGKNVTKTTDYSLPYIAATTGSVDVDVDDASADITSLGITKFTVVGSARTGFSSGVEVLAQMDDDTEDERVRIERNASNEVHAIVTVGGADVADLTLGTVANDTDFSYAFAGDTNDFEGIITGGSAQTDTGGALPSGIVTERVGTNSSQGEAWNSTVAERKIYNVRKTSAFLATAVAA